MQTATHSFMRLININILWYASWHSNNIIRDYYTFAAYTVFCIVSAVIVNVLKTVAKMAIPSKQLRRTRYIIINGHRDWRRRRLGGGEKKNDVKKKRSRWDIARIFTVRRYVKTACKTISDLRLGNFGGAY